MRRTLLRAVVSTLAISPAAVVGLGLGPMEIYSNLDQPLDARIPIVSAGAGDLAQLQIDLASPELFDRLGMERPMILTELSFKVEPSAAGGAFVHVTSEKPIREPLLDLLVETRWLGGALVRDYSIFLNPPSISLRHPKPTAATMPALAGAQVTRSPAIKTTVRNAPMAGDSSQRTYGPVPKGDTLWVIAERTRPSAGIAIPEMMAALLEANPHAFFAPNVDSLSAGATLRIPSASELGVAADERFQALDGQDSSAQQAGTLRLTTSNSDLPGQGESAHDVETATVDSGEALIHVESGGVTLQLVDLAPTAEEDAPLEATGESSQTSPSVQELIEQTLAEAERAAEEMRQAALAARGTLAEHGEAEVQALEPKPSITPSQAIPGPVQASEPAEMVDAGGLSVSMDQTPDDIEPAVAGTESLLATIQGELSDPRNAAMGGGALLLLVLALLAIRRRSKGPDASEPGLEQLPAVAAEVPDAPAALSVDLPPSPAYELQAHPAPASLSLPGNSERNADEEDVPVSTPSVRSDPGMNPSLATEVEAEADGGALAQVQDDQSVLEFDAPAPEASEVVAESTVKHAPPGADGEVVDQEAIDALIPFEFSMDDQAESFSNQFEGEVGDLPQPELQEDNESGAIRSDLELDSQLCLEFQNLEFDTSWDPKPDASADVVSAEGDDSSPNANLDWPQESAGADVLSLDANCATAGDIDPPVATAAEASDASDSIRTKLDLAAAYAEMGDLEGARNLYAEVLEEGSAEQQAKARDALAQLGDSDLPSMNIA